LTDFSRGLERVDDNIMEDKERGLKDVAVRRREIRYKAKRRFECVTIQFLGRGGEEGDGGIAVSGVRRGLVNEPRESESMMRGRG